MLRLKKYEDWLIRVTFGIATLRSVGILSDIKEEVKLVFYRLPEGEGLKPTVIHQR